jgi:hypothetical protein
MDSNEKTQTDCIDEPARKRIRPGMYMARENLIRFQYSTNKRFRSTIINKTNLI